MALLSNTAKLAFKLARSIGDDTIVPAARTIQKSDQGLSTLQALTKTEGMGGSLSNVDKALENIRKTGSKASKPYKSDALAEAAQKLDRGDITLKEFIKLRDVEKPLNVYGTVPKIDSPLKITAAIGKQAEKKGIIGLNRFLEEGQEVTSRFDINAYRNYNTYVATIQKVKDGKAGSVFGYSPTAILKEVTFKFKPEKAFRVAQGGHKSPFATMKGNWQQKTPQEAQEYSQALMNNNKVNKLGETSKEWSEVGFDPSARMSFYNRATGDPIFKADEVIQVGPMLLAKGIKKATKEQLKKLKVITTSDKEVGYKHGGSLIERNLYNYEPRTI